MKEDGGGLVDPHAKFQFLIGSMKVLLIFLLIFLL